MLGTTQPDVVGSPTAGALTQARQIAETAAAGAAEIDHDGAFPERDFIALADSGLLSAPLREDLGGLGFGSEPGGGDALLHLLLTLGWGNLSLARLYEGHVNALLLIQSFGTTEQAERYAADARDGHHRFGVWNTEGADGVRLISLGDRRYRLAGKKTFASGGGHLTRPLITGALPDGGWQMMVVPLDQASARVDTSWWRPLGMRASASHVVDLSGIEIGPEELVGQAGDYYREPWFSGGAIRFAAAQLGGAAALLDAACAELRAWGRADDPFQRARVGQAAIAIQSGMLWLHDAAGRADRSLLGEARPGAEEGDAEEMTAFANMTRSAIERICLDVLEHVERSLGARAMLRPHPVERIGRDLTLYLRQPAPDAALTRVGQHTLAAERSALALWPSSWPTGKVSSE